MPDDKVLVRARGAALCPDFDAMDREPALRRAIGRRYTEIKPGQFAWVPTGESEWVTKRAEIAYAIGSGDLYAGDAEAAQWAHLVSRKPVAFDATFGSETRAAKADKDPSVFNARTSKSGG